MSNRKRQLAAIMFTDIVGYSAMMQVDEEKATLIRNRHREVFRELHDKHGGKILQYYGDGTLSIFDSTVAAVECAVEMQVEFQKDPQVPLRVGIHTGDISYEDEGAYGDGLNIAARIEPLCVPGGVFISGKAFDDIKNHPWLTAKALGPHKLKNILTEVELYALTSRGLPVPEKPRPEPAFLPRRETYAAPASGPLANLDIDLQGPRNRKTAALLALILGIFGAHRFYLGQRKKGITYLVFGLIGLFSMGDGPFLAIMGIIAIIDAVLLYTMTDQEFERRYLSGQLEDDKAPTHAREKVYRREQEPGHTGNPYKRSGVRRFREGQYREALADFQRALEQSPEDMAVHFNLACCYSIFRDTEKSILHLSKAIEYGFWDYDKIQQHEALSFVRSTEAFRTFVANDYRLLPSLPPPEENLLESKPRQEPNLLDQIASLGDLMERGVITREEFDEQKRKLLSGE